jgi:hypothetical protein
MKNLTISIRDDPYGQARIYAASRDRTVSSPVTGILEDLPGF